MDNKLSHIETKAINFDTDNIMFTYDFKHILSSKFKRFAGHYYSSKT